MKPQKASPAPSPVPQGQGGTELQSWRDTGSSDTQSDHTPLAGASGPRAACACARFTGGVRSRRRGWARTRSVSRQREKQRPSESACAASGWHGVGLVWEAKCWGFP